MSNIPPTEQETQKLCAQVLESTRTAQRSLFGTYPIGAKVRWLGDTGRFYEGTVTGYMKATPFFTIIVHTNQNSQFYLDPICWATYKEYTPCLTCT